MKTVRGNRSDIAGWFPALVSSQRPYNIQILDCESDSTIGILLCGYQENDKAEEDGSTRLQTCANWDILGFGLYIMNTP